MQARRVLSLALSVSAVLAVPGCGDRSGPDDAAVALDGSANALREFVARHPETADAALARARLSRLGPTLPGFDAVFPSEVGYVCHLQEGDVPTPIPEDVIAYVARPGAALAWSTLAEVFVYESPFVLRPAIDARGPVGMAKNAEGRSVRTGKRCINAIQYEGDTVNVAKGLQFAPGGTLAGPRR